ICTVTGVSPIRTVVLPLRYQPSDFVENSFGSAANSLSPIFTTTGLALVWNSARVIEQLGFAIVQSPCKRHCLVRKAAASSPAGGGQRKEFSLLLKGRDSSPTPLPPFAPPVMPAVNSRLSLPLWTERYAAPPLPMSRAETEARGWDSVDV